MTMKPMIVNTRPAIASQVSGMSCHSGRVPASLRSCLILTPHAHRKKAAVGASTSTMTSKTMRMGIPALGKPLRRRRLLRRQDKVQVLQHARCRAPDVPLAVRHGVVTPLAALVLAAADLVIDLVEEVVERHLEHVRHFARLRTDGEARRHDADYRRDLEPGSCVIKIDRTHNIDEIARDADFLLG